MGAERRGPTLRPRVAVNQRWEEPVPEAKPYDKRFRRRERASIHWLGRIARRDPNLLALWLFGMKPEAGG